MDTKVAGLIDKMRKDISKENLNKVFSEIIFEFSDISREDLIKLSAFIAGSITISLALIELATIDGIIGSPHLSSHLVSYGTTFTKFFIGAALTKYIYDLLCKFFSMFVKGLSSSATTENLNTGISNR